MNKFKLSLVCMFVSQVIAGQAMAHTVSVDGVIDKDIAVSGGDEIIADIKDSFKDGTITTVSDTSVITATATGAISAGTQNFHDGSALVVSVANGVTGGRAEPLGR